MEHGKNFTYAGLPNTLLVIWTRFPVKHCYMLYCLKLSLFNKYLQNSSFNVLKAERCTGQTKHSSVSPRFTALLGGPAAFGLFSVLGPGAGHRVLPSCDRLSAFQLIAGATYFPTHALCPFLGVCSSTCAHLCLYVHVCASGWQTAVHGTESRGEL